MARGKIMWAILITIVAIVAMGVGHVAIHLVYSDDNKITVITRDIVDANEYDFLIKNGDVCVGLRYIPEYLPEPEYGRWIVAVVDNPIYTYNGMMDLDIEQCESLEHWEAN